MIFQMWRSGMLREVEAMPLRALLWLAGGLVMCLVPFAGQVPWIALGAVVALAGWRCRIAVTGGRLPPQWMRLLLFALALGYNFMFLGGLFSMRAAAVLLLMLSALKLMELRTARDFSLLAFLCYFLVLAGLFFEITLPLFIYLTGAVMVITGALIHLNSGVAARRSHWATLRLAGVMLAQSLPLLVGLFLFFPRVSGGFIRPMAAQGGGQTGMSDSLNPGEFSSLSRTAGKAFRVEFPDGNVPPVKDRYWRGLVLWGNRGFGWSRGAIGMLASPLPLPGEPGRRVRQRITLEPGLTHWIFALDRPAAVPAQGVALMQPGHFLIPSPATMARGGRRFYEVESLPGAESGETELAEDNRKVALYLQKDDVREMPRLKALVAEWRAKAGSDDRALVNLALRYFRRGGFLYTTEPGTFSQEADGLETFLFERKKGFCEHYASVFGVLMRMSGIPARVVVGYQGGIYNSVGNFLQVRQADAHAWNEVWLEGTGWTRVDVTAYVAPERLEFGMDSFRQLEDMGAMSVGERVAALSRMGDKSFLVTLLTETRAAWDTVDYNWNIYVLGYDAEGQQGFFQLAGLGDFTWAKGWLLTLAALVAGVAVAVAILSLLRTRPSAATPASRAYGKFCLTLKRAGLTRDISEGPMDFARRAAEKFPGSKEAIQTFTELYVGAVYGPADHAPENVRQLNRLARKFRPRSSGG